MSCGVLMVECGDNWKKFWKREHGVSVSLLGFPIYFGLLSIRKELGALWWISVTVDKYLKLNNSYSNLIFI